VAAPGSESKGSRKQLTTNASVLGTFAKYPSAYPITTQYASPRITGDSRRGGRISHRIRLLHHCQFSTGRLSADVDVNPSVDRIAVRRRNPCGDADRVWPKSSRQRARPAIPQSSRRSGHSDSAFTLTLHIRICKDGLQGHRSADSDDAWLHGESRIKETGALRARTCSAVIERALVQEILRVERDFVATPGHSQIEANP